jgi:dTDP-4-amino-4,6-dideoxygalactose transaminase
VTEQEFRALCIPPTCSLRDALERLNRTARGALLVLAADGTLQRTLTDGDMRRAALEQVPASAPVAQLPWQAPLTIGEDEPLAAAVALMDRHEIDHIPVLDPQGRAVDLVLRRELSQRIWLSSPHLGDEETAFVEEAFRTNWIAPLGPHVDAFERELAAHVGIGHAAALSSGTAAIHLGLLLLGVQPGDTVFCSSLTFVGSCNPILYCGARPVFIDSEPQSWNMSPAALERAFEWAQREGRLPRCVVVVNLYGQSADMDALAPVCERYGVPMLEDAAESLGASYRGRASGTFGRLGVYSFNGNKIITTSGGGMLVADDPALVARARKLATQAREPAPHYEHQEVGFNYRMSNVLAGIGRGQLRVLEQRVAQRRAVFEAYRDALADVAEIEWMPQPPAMRSTRWLTCFTLAGADGAARRDRLLRNLERHSIEARPVWKPMHLQPLFRGAPYFTHGPGDDVAARLFEAGVCLPSGSNLSTAQLARVIDQLRRALARAEAPGAVA